MSCPLEVVQTGELCLSSRLRSLQDTISVLIRFDVPFNNNGEIPQVGVFLHEFDLNQGSHTNINALPSHVTYEGFTLEAGSWDDAHLKSLKVYWVASTHPAVSIINIEVGSKPNAPLSMHTLRLFYPTPYEDAPVIVSAINRVELDKSSNRRLRTHIENITNLGFTLVTSTWDDTKLWNVGYSLIILSQPRFATSIAGGVSFHVFPKCVPDTGDISRVSVRDFDVSAHQASERRDPNLVVICGVLGMDICKSSHIRMEVFSQIVGRSRDNFMQDVDFVARSWDGGRVYGGQIATLVLNTEICVGGSKEDIIQRRTILEHEIGMFR